MNIYMKLYQTYVSGRTASEKAKAMAAVVEGKKRSSKKAGFGTIVSSLCAIKRACALCWVAKHSHINGGGLALLTENETDRVMGKLNLKRVVNGGIDQREIPLKFCDLNLRNVATD